MNQNYPRTIRSLEDNIRKWDYERWHNTGINLRGSHSPTFWAQALTHFEQIYLKTIQPKSIADIGCGLDPLDFKALKEFKSIETVIRADGSQTVAETVKDVRVENFNKNPLPLEDNEVEFAISFEVIEHMFSTYGFLKEMARISKYGFLISKPNTDFDGLNSHWYGEKYFFETETPLADGGIRFEHINFIPNYELFGFAKVLDYTCILLDDDDEEMQFFLFLDNKFL